MSRPKVERLHLIAAERLINDIEAKIYNISSSLPAERELAARLGVSRPVVREALVAVEERGYLTVKPNGGYNVADWQAKRPIHPGIGETGPFEVTEARRLLEPEIAALVAATITPEQLQELERTLAVMEDQSRESHQREKADRNFHLLLARFTGNDALVSIIEQLWDMRYKSPLCEYFFEQARKYSMEPANQHHRTIVEAMRTRDSAKARETMRDHLFHAMDNLQSAMDADARERARLKVIETSHSFARRARPLD